MSKLPEMQISFIDSICAPIYAAFSKQFPHELGILLEGCLANRDIWSELARGNQEDQNSKQKNNEKQAFADRMEGEKKNLQLVCYLNDNVFIDNGHTKENSASDNRSNNKPINNSNDNNNLSIPDVNSYLSYDNKHPSKNSTHQRDKLNPLPLVDIAQQDNSTTIKQNDKKFQQVHNQRKSI